MLTQLRTDLCRLLKHNLTQFDNEASACYDRIIVALEMLAARRCGMPDTAIKTHTDCLRLMKYTIKTVHGVSESNYHGTTFEPLFDTGQGSGTSPSVWLTLVVVLMNTLDRIVPDRMQFQSSDSTSMLLNLKYSQIESGISCPLLEYPGLGIPYLTPTWITSVRQFLFQHNLTISLTDAIEILLRGRFDKYIMDNDALSRYTTRQQTDINLVRLYLQIITLSDISHKDGTTACEYHICGERRPNQRIRIKTWPRQETATKQQVQSWRRYISSNFLRYSTKWKTPLGVMTKKAPAVSPATQHLTLRSHIASLPLWHRRLLYEYHQLSTDLEVWRAFRSRRRLTIASDGSLRDNVGTFGWKLTTHNHQTLFHGYGPVDGPMEIGSSTRSELGGFTAPLLLITVLAWRHWGLRHRCTFRWLAVTFVTRKDYSPTKQPYNSDYLSTIKDLSRELRRPMKKQWIKSNQDGKTPYAKLTPDTQLNVDVDDLATKCHQNKKAKPRRRTTDHISGVKMSISIIKTRYYGNVNAHIRYHINGSYLQGYTQA